MADAKDEKLYKDERLIAIENAILIGKVVLSGSDEACQSRVDLLMKAAPELFPS